MPGRCWTAVGSLTLLLALCAVGMVGEARGQVAESMSAEQVQRLWQMHWREIAQYYFEYDGEFVLFRTYNPANLNSSGMAPRDYERQSAREFEIADAGGMQKRTISKPRDEVDAATRVLPDFAPGAYGYIDSGEVDAILPSGAVRLSDVRLIPPTDLDAERARLRQELMSRGMRGLDAGRNGRRGRGPGRGGPDFGRAVGQGMALIDWSVEERERVRSVERRHSDIRLTIEGFNTERLVTGRRWPAGDQGLHIAIVKREGRNVTAVPVAHLRRGISEEQFTKLLASRNLDKQQFAQAVIEQKRRDPKNFTAQMIAWLEGDVVELAEPAPEVELDPNF